MIQILNYNIDSSTYGLYSKISQKLKLSQDITQANRETLFLKDICKRIKKSKTVLYILEKEDEIGAAWLIRVHDWSNEITEVQVVAVKVENSVLFYKGKENGEVDEDWQTMAVEDDVVSATIDSVYTAVYLTLED